MTSLSWELSPKSSAGQAPVRSREVRLGLVLYGGVSLAIYINGVANEFFRAVRGRGVYRLLKALTDSDVAVDIISGTSAGGINGIFLAFCLCNERSRFERSARLWRQHGDIRALLRNSDDEQAFLSLLDSEGYYRPKLEEALAAMHSPLDSDGQGEDSLEDRSLVNELDLFITGTDMKGNTSTQFDDAGHHIHVKEHRSVFLLKHRKDRKEPFRLKNGEPPQESATVKSLAKLACITSCFPSAFSPVWVSPMKANAQRSSAREEDDNLQKWGQLAQEQGRYFLDGGVLDNKPFSYTLRAIFSRHALNEVDRKLCYVEPVPEPAPEYKSTSPSGPHILKAVIASLIGIPRYESISEDLKALADHNSRVQRYNRILSELKGMAGGALITQEASAEQKAIYTRSRLVALSEYVLRGLFRVSGREVAIDLQKPEVRQRAEELVRSFDQVGQSATGQAFDVDYLFDNLDVTFRLRRLYHTAYLLHDVLAKNLGVDGFRRAHYQQLWHVLNRQIELHEILQSEMQWLIDEAKIDWQSLEVESPEQARRLWRMVQYAFDRLLEDSEPLTRVLPRNYDPKTGWEWLPTAMLRDFHGALRERSRSILQDIERGALPDTWAPSGKSLLRRFARYEAEILEHFVPTETDHASPVRKTYEHFKSTDTLLFPLELISNLREKDVVEAVRISPCDARKGFSRLEAQKKLSGDMAGNFGGFFKRSWRANDILWGRLDGVCQLVEILLTRKRLECLTSTESSLKAVRERLLKHPGNASSDLDDTYDPAHLFPLAGEQTHQQLREWFKALMSADPRARRDALSETRFLEMQTLLIEAAQLEIINTELENVLADAREELECWKRSRFVRGKEAADREAVLAHLKSKFDQSRDSQNRDGAGGRPAETALGRYFIEDYRIGAEELLHDIPRLVLLDIAMTVLTVLQNGLLKILGMSAPGIVRAVLRSGIQTTGFLARAVGGFLEVWHRVSRPSLSLAPRPRESRPAAPQVLPDNAGHASSQSWFARRLTVLRPRRSET
jgi:patatin-related protein